MNKYTKLCYDSRKVEPGALFFCKGKGFKKEYLEAAIKRGAAAYVSETDYHLEIPCIKASDIRASMADIADEFHKHAWKAYPSIGLTGSKGKSTTLYFIKSIFEAAGKNIAFLSTIDTYDGIESFESHLTTPEAIDLHRHFDNARKAGVDAFVMEVSSQGLKYDRTKNVIFSIGAFLNFGSDHIGEGEHSDIEDYFQSKLKLMSQCKIAVINKKSDRFEEIIKAAKSSIVCEKIICYSEDDYDKSYKLSIPGSFNFENAACAMTIARELGIEEEFIKEGLAKASVPGRMEIFENKEKEIVCIVDYAHSILSFDKLFESVKEMYPGFKIEALFGCPGGKGLQRRYDLPMSVSKYADFVWITEEDPGLEDPKLICETIKSNLDKFGTKNKIIVDRDEAIKEAIHSAKAKTVIVLTGKGREEYMHRGNDYVPFTPETTQVERALNEL